MTDTGRKDRLPRMARGGSRVEKVSDTQAPHPFLFYLFPCLFSFLEGLEPAHTPVRSPGPPAPLPEPLPSPQPAPVSPPPSSGAPGAGPSQRTSPTSWCPSQPRASLLGGVPGLAQRHTEVPGVEGTGKGRGGVWPLLAFPPLASQALAVLTGGPAPRRVQGPGATAAGGQQGAAAGRGEPRRGSRSGASQVRKPPPPARRGPHPSRSPTHPPTPVLPRAPAFGCLCPAERSRTCYVPGTVQSAGTQSGADTRVEETDWGGGVERREREGIGRECRFRSENRGSLRGGGDE